MRRVAYGAALLAATVSLAGCQSFRDAAGLNKMEPDEFAVATKAPLIVPPEYNLKPPQPGAAPANQLDPTDSAQAALYGQKAPVTSSRGQLSVGEQELLAKAGASDSNDMIRQRIAADNRDMQAADQSFTNKILFGMAASDNSAVPVDANAEHQRLKQPGAAPAQQQDTIEKTKDSDDSGWFDGIF